MNPQSLHRRLLDWYKNNKRDLPWRKSQDPYRVWVSEIMLQQTRVEAAIPYYEKFLSHFPNLQALAAAPQDKVLSLWSGLGYYSRARNLHKAAQSVVQNFGAKMPSSIGDLRSLSGIGEYTSHAIASIAFGQEVPAIDGNLERVLARLLDLRENPKKEGKAEIQKLAWKIARLGEAGSSNQAFMDLSSLLCLPKLPRCQICPLSQECGARKSSSTDLVPLRAKPAKALPLKSQAFLVLHRPPKSVPSILLARRKSDQWLADMWDIPWQVAPFAKTWKKQVSWRAFGSHSLTRPITKYKLEFNVTFFQISKKQFPAMAFRQLAGSEWRWVKISDLAEINLPRPSHRALERALAKLK